MRWTEKYAILFGGDPKKYDLPTNKITIVSRSWVSLREPAQSCIILLQKVETLRSRFKSR
jgi:hypothetical protein